MHRKYLFFDYDGTLRSHKFNCIPDSAQQTLELLKKAGHHISLATGRLQLDALNLVRDSGITTMVADGGNSVTIDGELCWMEPMPLKNCTRFMQWLESKGYMWAVTVRNELVRYTPFERFAENLPDTYIRTDVCPELTANSFDKIYKIFVPCSSGEEYNFDFCGVTWARYIPQAIYCEPTDKSVGIKMMMDILGAPYEDVIVFGDGSNDRDMFLPEWTSVAMGNAIDELKAKADFVTTSVDDDGIYNACVALGLI